MDKDFSFQTYEEISYKARAMCLLRIFANPNVI